MSSRIENHFEYGRKEEVNDGMEKEESDTEDESSSDSDEEELERKPKETVKGLTRKIINDIRDETGDITHDFSDFEAGEGQRLIGLTGDPRYPTPLHAMLAQSEDETVKDSVSRLVDDRIKPLVTFLVERSLDEFPDDLLHRKDNNGKTALLLAIEHKREKMVKWICEAASEERISAILGITNDIKENCLHMAVRNRLKYTRQLIQRVSPQTLVAKNKDGNTPLHLAVEYRRCRKDQWLTIEDITARSDYLVKEHPEIDFNKNGHSPYLHHKKTVEEAADKKESKKEKKREKSGAKDIAPTSRLKDASTSLPKASSGKPTAPDVAMPGRYKGAPDQQFKQTAQQANRQKFGSQTSERDYYLVRVATNIPHAANISSPLAKEATGSLLRAEGPSTEGKESVVNGASGAAETASKSKSKPKSAAPDSKGSSSSSKVDEAVVMQVERNLKLHYMRSRKDDVCKDILYGKDDVSDPELYFDLSGSTNMDEERLESLMKKLKFQNVLQYVAIPRIRIKDVSSNSTLAAASEGRRESRQKRSMGSKDEFDGTGRRDLQMVFDKLHDKKGVTTILKVVVDDLGPSPHTDEAIESSLKHRGVETWDWRRVDLCSEVIYNAAPTVREVHLYWSGNNAVLRSWCDEGGLKMLQDLTAVDVHVQPDGYESTRRTEKYLEYFTNQMKNLCPNVKVTIRGLSARGIFRRQQANVGAARAGEAGPGKENDKHAWVQCMDEFSRMLFDAERILDKRSEGKYQVHKMINEKIKVALIDDGVDGLEIDSYDLLGGRSFCQRDENHRLNHSYYSSSTGHGTIMAKAIYAMCPRAQFYVLRLEDHESVNGNIQITARSATAAIWAAIKKKVHIISMSWTIDPPKDLDQEDGEVKRKLADAIQAAANANILMFCAASDKGAKFTDTFPSRASNCIFTIGAADATGAVDAWVGNPLNVNFTFPGTNVDVDDSALGKNVTGSSIATAYAAGLAALILYIVQIKLLRATNPAEKAAIQTDFDKIRKHDGMMKAFRKVGTTPESQNKFIAVWDVFGAVVEEKDRYNKMQQELIDQIANLGSKFV